MKNVWIICMVLVAGVTLASGNPCNTTNAEECYADLVNYESVAFPLYGSDRAKLADTCGNMNMSLECIDSYSKTCHENPNCDEDCEDLLRYIHVFLANSGLPSIGQDLCTEDNPLKDVYLENYECLEKNKDTYAKCHAESKESQEYLRTFKGPEAIEPRCCYFSWYFGCFINVTRDHCSQNATFFVSYALHKLVGHISEQLCANVNTTCSSEGPPLPPPDGGEDDAEVTTENGHAEEHGGSMSIKYSANTLSVIILVLFLIK